MKNDTLIEIKKALLFFLICVVISITIDAILSILRNKHSIDGVYKVLNHCELEDSTANIWRFEDGGFHTENGSFNFIYKETKNGRFLFIREDNSKYNVIFEEDGTTQLHQVSGAHPWTCYFLEQINP